MRKLDLARQRFGRLLAIEPGEPEGRRRGTWLCECDCGTRRTFWTESLRSGATRSCGCLQREMSRERHTKHGLSASREFWIWAGMIDRCSRTNNKSFRYYGGRGIRVCDRWKSFESFYADMGQRPDGLTIDRINPDGNYEPENCRWAPRRERRVNRSKP